MYIFRLDKFFTFHKTIAVESYNSMKLYTNRSTFEKESIVPKPFFGFQMLTAVAANVTEATKMFTQLLWSQRRHCSLMSRDSIIEYSLIKET